MVQQKDLSQLHKCCLLFCISITFALAGFSKANAQENMPPKVPSSVRVESNTTPQQTRENTVLPSKRYKLSIDFPGTVYSLPALDLTKIDKKAANQIGVDRNVSLSIKNNGKRFRNADGSEIRILSIKSPGAIGIRIHFEDFNIGDGDEVYIYGSALDSEVQGPHSRKGPWGDSEFWSGTVSGDTAIIEYYAKNGASDFRLSKISHIYENPNGLALPQVLSCEIDASCYNNSEKNAVGRIVFQNGGSFVCSGTLLNDRNSTFTPYFLTANHCVSSQAIAQTVETYWFYQTTACNSGALRSDIVHAILGANLLVSSQTYDSTLLRIVGQAPSGAAFSGWDAGTKSVNTLVHGFHHPGGGTPPSTMSFLRRSDGKITNTSTSCSATGLTGGYFINWTSGLTEGGSSGSGLWYSSQGSSYLIGVDSCGPANPDCNFNGNTFAIYGKFSDFYPLIQSYIYPISVGDSAPNPQLFIDAFNRSGFSQFVNLPPINTVHRWDCSTCDPNNPSWGKGLIQDFNGTTSGVHDALMLADTNTSFVAQIYGGMWDKFIQLGDLNYNSANTRMLGYPIADRNCSDYNAQCFTDAQLVSPFGTSYHYQRFQGGALVLHKSGARINQTFEVHGAIRSRWQVLGGPSSGSYGLPITDEYAFQSKRRSDFEGGSICYNPATGQTEDGCVATSPPPAPTANAATSVTSNGFTANWNSSNGATGYRLDVSTSISFSSYVSGYQDLDVGNVLSRSVSGLNAGTTYYYRARAYNTGGTSGNSGIIPVTTSTTTVQVTLQTNPAGRSFTVDGNTYTSTQTFSWTSGSSHTIGTTSLQSGGTGTQYVWSSWSDGGNMSHNVSPTTNTNYTANFTTQYQLTTSASPANGGTVSPTSGNWYGAGQSVSISAVSNGGYSFSSWMGTGSGSYTGTNNPATVTMNGPISETASFIQNPTPVSVTVGTNLSGRSFTVDGTNYTSTQTFSWTAGSSHTISTASPQSGGTGTQYVWSSWSDGGSISHNVAPTSNTTYTANFATQYFLTMNAGTGGIVSPPSGWYNSGTGVGISATPNSGFSFSGWTGSGSGSFTGSSNPASVTMNGPISETASFTNTGGIAVYDSVLKAPKCGQLGSICDSGTLLDGRDNITGGPEPNQPNTINNSCADGTFGTYHTDESVDSIKVSTLDGSNFAPGKAVRIDVTFWAFSTSLDYLDLFYAADASSPNWIYLLTVQPTGTGSQVVTTTYQLPTGGSLQAVRAVFRYQGTASSCGNNSGWDDYDDLIFAASSATPPANDNLSNAQIISGSSGSVSGNNVGAAKELGEPNHAGNVGGVSVWYRWQASSNGTATINTAGSNFDTLLGVYTGSSVSALTTIASNDDNPAGGLQSIVTFSAIAGTVYYIAVDGYNGATGNITLNWSLTSNQLRIDNVNPKAGRVAGGQQITLTGEFAGLSTVTIGGTPVSWSYTSGTSAITFTSPTHAVGAVDITLTFSSGGPLTRSNAFAYLLTVFTDDTLVVGATTAKAQHIIELRQAVDALRAVAGLQPAPWTDATLTPMNTFIKAVHIQELRTYLDDAASRLGYSTSPYTDLSLTTGFFIKRIHIEELRQRIRTIAG